MKKSNCCDGQPFAGITQEIDGMHHGVCFDCGQHAVFYDFEQDMWRDNTLEKDKEQHGELWETIR